MSTHLFSTIKLHKTKLLRHLSYSHLSHHAVPYIPHSISTVHSPNPVSYDSLISTHVKNFDIENAFATLTTMLLNSYSPTSFTLVPIISYKHLDLSRGIHLHTLLIKNGLLHSEPYSATALLSHYAKNYKMDYAVKLFDEMHVKTVVTWNSIISGFGSMGFVQDCVFMFNELLKSEIRPSEYSLLAVLTVGREMESSCLLEQVHGLVLKLCMDCFVVVGNALLSAYWIFFDSSMCERVFGELCMKDLVTWNTSIGVFAKSDVPGRGLEMFFSMLGEGFLPNENTLASVLIACVGVDSEMYGEIIHAKAVKHNLSANVYVGSALVDFYAKCKSLEYALKIFNEIPDKNEGTWNILISNFSLRDSSNLILHVKEMMHSGCRPNEFTFSSTLTKVGALDLKQLHSFIIKTGYESYGYVSTSLIASYDAHDMITDALVCSSNFASPVHITPYNVIAGICNRAGHYEDTKKMLLQMHYPDAISWNILLAACARNGDYSEALYLFKKMQNLGYFLDNYTSISLLSICSKTSNLNLGGNIHGLIIKTNAGYSEVFVSNVLMDMYARSGNLDDCIKVFNEMKERNLISWTSLISGLGLHGRMHEALERFSQMESEGYKPDKVVFHAVLSACRHGGLVEQGMMLFEKMKSFYKIEPEMDHYVTLVDLLSKYGHFEEAELVICGMPFQPNGVIWRVFLQGCKKCP